MELSPDTYRTCWDLHAWGGVVIGLFVSVMFITGAVVVFQDAIATWQDPYAQRPASEASLDRSVRVAVDGFDGDVPARFGVRLPSGERGTPRVSYVSPETGRYTEDWIDVPSERTVDKPDKLATLLYHVHTFYDTRFPQAYYLAGWLSLAMLLVLATGVAIQWRNLVDEFHQFRPDGSAFVTWNDLHKVVGVASLPFQAFYAYSAVVIVLGPFFVDAVAGPIFDGDAASAREATYGRLGAPPEAGSKTDTMAVDAALDRARSAMPALEAQKLTIHNWGTAGAALDIVGGLDGERFSQGRVRVGLDDASLLQGKAPDDQTWAVEIRRWLIETHGVQLGGFGTNLLFALLALAGGASMLAGMAVWTERRRRRREAWVDTVLERLTAGVGTATLLAAAAVFLASRALPWEMAGRWALEVRTYYVTWLACVAAAFVAPSPRRLWRTQLTVTGLALLATTAVAARLSGAGLFGLLVGGRETIPAVLGVDIGLAAAGITSLAIAARIAPVSETEGAV